MNIFMTLCNDCQNRRNGINSTTNKNYVASYDANAQIVNPISLSYTGGGIEHRSCAVGRNCKPIARSQSKIFNRKSSIVNTLALLFAFCVLFGGKAWADELTVYDGTTGGTTATNSNVPVWGLWTDNSLKCEIVYPSAELNDMAGGTITGLTYYTSTNVNIGTNKWNGTCEIFIKEVESTTLSDFTGTNNATDVYNASISVVDGEMTIVFGTSYHYNGGNLLIGFYYTTGGSYNSVTWSGETVSSASIYGRSGSSYSVNNANFLPKTTFTYTPCSPSRSLSFANCPTSVGIGSAINCTPLPSIGSGYGTITYTSSNTDVATVDANTGLVTGVSAGDATITAKLSYSGGYCPATATHNVYVIPTPQIEISAINGNNFTLNASITESFPSGYSYHWYRDEACTQEISGASGTNNANLTYSPSCDERVYCRLQKNTTENQVANFGFSGETVQTYTIPVGVTSVNMEVWGAQGGGSHDAGVFYPDRGGLGGYSKGTFSTQAGQALYVCVGGRGSDGVTKAYYPSSLLSAPGGYNGGGTGARDNEDSGQGPETGGGGGGATHIATSTGVLASLFPSNTDKILIVAGGGGGSSCQAPGGCGGGETGGDAYWGGGSPPITWQQNDQGGGRGGSSSTNCGSGQGAQDGSQEYSNGVGGGGGGYYGGCIHADNQNGRRNSGGGGSGFLKNTLSSSQTIAGSNSFVAPESGNETGHPGNGYARITASSVTVVGAAQSIIMKTSPSMITSIVAPDAVCYGGSISITQPEYAENGSTVTSTGWEIASSESGPYTPISQISSSDANKYARFVATNGCGSARSNSVQIANMKPSPSVSSITDAVTANCGDYVSLSATPSSGNISWYSDANCTNEISSANVLALGKLTANATYYAKANETFDLGIEEIVYDYNFEGYVQELPIPEGTIAAKLEVWGAQGGNETYGGKGGYSVGMLNNLNGISNLYVYVGERPEESNKTGGWNGGGGYTNFGTSGGGATDISLHNYDYNTTTHYNDRIIVAGGGGGKGYNTGTNIYGGYGGGLNGGTGGNGDATIGGGGASQTSGGSGATPNSGYTSYPSYSGGFGEASTSTNHNGGGGGGGWYGGGSGVGSGTDAAGGGGSGYVWTSATASNAPSGYSVPASCYLTDAQTIDGSNSFSAPDGSMETGHSGHGFARITLYRHKTITCASAVQSAPVTINQIPEPTVNDVTICDGTQTELVVVTPVAYDVTYSWNSGSATSDNTYTTSTLSSNEHSDKQYTYTVVATRAVPNNANNIVASYDFDYTGRVQEVEVPAGADYAILEVWGAQGGYSLENGVPSGQGGKGGYSYGYYVPSVGQTLYVVVGGKGTDGIERQDSPGGYNGGGMGTWDNNDNETSGGGGGATHIATSTGVLSSLSGNSSAVLIVAGGGGGASWDTNGGYGGGAAAGSGAGSGTSISGAFGYGADATGHTGNGDGVGGGGGGYQGGRAYDCKSGSSNAEGGTGYINTGQVTDAILIAGNSPIPNHAGGSMVVGNEGNGHARIIFYGNGGSAGSCVSAVKNITVTVNAKPTDPTSVSIDNVICNGTEYTLTANGATLGSGAEYRWGIGSEVGTSPIDGSTASITISPNANTTYWVCMKGTSKCKDYTTGYVMPEPIIVNTPVPSITGATTICSSGATLTATGGSQYKWNGDSNFSGTASKNITSAGTYTVTIMDANGCTASTSREVKVKTTPSVSINSYTTPVDCGTEVNLSATSGQTVNWYSDSDCTASASPTFTPTNDAVTRYAKVATDYAGIIDTIDYDTPGIYEFVVPSNVNSIKMEVWGAQGGYGRGNENSNDPARGDGGKGGYATGKLSVTEGQHLYVVVGGKGEDAVFGNIATPAFTAKGGYNGGGNGSCDKDAANDLGREASGAGGGATHIATASGMLSSLSGNTGAVLLVAGGGGGGSWRYTGGYGGGADGGPGGSKDDYEEGLGGGHGGGQSPRSDASPQVNGTFGQGAQYPADGNGDGVAGGGGGYYGGNANTHTSHDPNAGGGGSGYCKTSTLSETSLIAGNTEMPNPAGGTMTGKEGNGFARIIVYRSSPLTCSSTASATVSVTPASVELNTISVAPILICAGTTKELTASTSSIHGVPSYSWTPADGLSADNENATISAAGTYTYNVTATLNNNDACKATDSKTVTVSYKTPSLEDIEAMGGIADGNILWTGNSTDWNGTNNWMQYTAASGTYTLTSAPTSSSNVVVGKYSDCVTGTPILNLNTTANVDTLKIGSGVTVSGENAVNLYGNLVNGGTFDAPVNFAGTTKLRGAGSTTIRNITINPGRSFNADDKSLSISGNWTNNGTFSSTGTVTFAGGATQTIGGNAATAFNNVTFNNANGINISTVPTINGEANFSNGVVSGNVTFGSEATASAINASKNSYVDGLVTKSGSANGFTFPTGDNGNLGTVKVTSAASNVSVQYFGTEAGFGDSDLPRWWNVADMCGEDQFNHISNIEYWKISSVSGFTANFTADAGSDMHFNSNPENDRDPDNVQMAFFGSNCWTNIGGSTSIDGNKITMTGVTIPENTTRDISGNYIAPASKSKSTVLPIELLSFTAACNGKYAELAWTTASERNNDYFVIERSDDAINFTEVGRVAGAGNSIEQLDYTYNDYGIHGGDNYYRLVQVDYDGTRSVSDIVVATCIDTEVDEPDVQAYPNPFNGELTVVLDNFDNRSAIIEVYDMLGKLIYMQKAASPQNSYETILNLSNLPTGAYNVRVSTADFVINRQVVKN